ncbi:hypothetical protein [Herbaspirillum robiniae]|uniref:hypothetical protein n=1 Tax=Herbaspirillum robiniae TaxID=2014887 RepID=UPI00101AEC57|nr:hypothetical protein [Herbaspirillum robiniae]
MAKTILNGEVDLSHAYRTFERLQQESGDIEGIYWYKVACFVKESEEAQARALAAKTSVETQKPVDGSK